MKVPPSNPSTDPSKRLLSRAALFNRAISTRHISVEVDHKVVMVDALTRYRDGGEELYLSLEELEQIGRAAAKAATARRNQRPD